jgi:hypothetical protein
MFVAYDGSTETVDALIGTWLATGALIDDASGSKITGGLITIPLQPDGSWKASPAADDNLNGTTMVLDFENADNQYVTPILLPAYLDSFVVNGKINYAATALAALIANILSTAGTADYQSRDLKQLSALRDGFLADRKQRGQRARTRTLA